MRFLFLLFLVALGTYLGIKLNQDTGYALFSYGTYAAEMPLWLAVLGVIALFVIMYIGLKFISTLFGSYDSIRKWRARSIKKEARYKTNLGILDFSKGKLISAEKSIVEVAKNYDMPLISYLTAAKIAQARGDMAKRDEYLNLANNYAANDETVLSLNKAAMYIESDQAFEAVAILENLNDKDKKNSQVLTLLYKAYNANEDVDKLYALLPILKKERVFLKEKFIKVEKNIIQQYISNKNQKLSVDDYKNIWNKCSNNLHSDAGFVEIFVKNLVLKDKNFAEKIIHKTLLKTYSDNLVLRYSCLNVEPKAQLNFIESLIKKYPDNYQILLAAGRICLYGKLWGKAKDFFNASIQIKPTSLAYAEMARLLTKLGDNEKSNEYYRKGLLASTEVVRL